MQISLGIAAPEWCAGPAFASSHFESLPVIEDKKEVFTEPHTNASKMRPIMAAAYHNRTRSLLCRLPDVILVGVMQHADPVSLECLRRCSRIFLRLFPAACSSERDFSMNVEQWPWPTSMLSLLPEEKESLLSLLAKDQYCQICLTARQSRGWQERLKAATKVYLHCSGCQKDHPVCLFSAKQRQCPQSTRICIGHEGYLRLCEHVTVPWCRLVSFARRMSILRVGIFRLTYCQQPKHLNACRQGRRFFDFACLDPWYCSRCPSIWGYYPMTQTKTYYSVEMNWSVHLPLATTRDRHLGAEELAQGLEKLR